MKRRSIMLVLLVVAATARPPDRLIAQAGPDTTPPATATPDTSHLVGPIGALWRSLLLPGWGQAATGRNVTGAIFGIWEGTTLYMTLKAQQEANYFKEANLPNLHAKRQEVQDWLVLWIFNHFFSGAEAFVSAHLQDFPKDLKIRAFPSGVGITVRVP